MYTSGWPKNQNTCCHSSTSPPWAGLKKYAPRRRSANSMISPAVSTGVASTISSEVASMLQTNTGSRVMVMPGARRRRIVTMKLMPLRMDAVPTTISPTIHRSWPAPPCSETGA